MWIGCLFLRVHILINYSFGSSNEKLNYHKNYHKLWCYTLPLCFFSVCNSDFDSVDILAILWLCSADPQESRLPKLPATLISYRPKHQ